MSHRTNTVKLNAVLLEIYLQGATETILGRRSEEREEVRIIKTWDSGKKVTAKRSTTYYKYGNIKVEYRVRCATRILVLRRMEKGINL